MSILEYAKYGKSSHKKVASAKGDQVKTAEQEKDANALAALATGGALLSGGLLAGGLLRSTYDSIRRDAKARQIFESLSRDPQLSNIDRGKLAEWFAAIYHYSPTAATDRATVKELMHQFAMFGKVDLQTLKTLAEIEEKRTSSVKDMYESRGAGAHVNFAHKSLDIARSLWGR